MLRVQGPLEFPLATIRTRLVFGLLRDAVAALQTVALYTQLKDRAVVYHPIVLCLAFVNYPHVQGMTENECYPLLCIEIGDPVPAEDAFNPDQDVGWIRLDRLEKRFRAGLHVAMEYGLTVCVDYAEVHHPGVQVDTAVILVRRTVEYLRASFFRNTGYTGSISMGCAKADASMSINRTNQQWGQLDVQRYFHDGLAKSPAGK